MDPKKRNNLILFIGALFVAVIFITSYAAFSSNGSNTQSTTTASNARTYLVVASANAVIRNYSNIAAVSNVSKNQTTSINNTLDGMQSNGTVSSYIYINSTYRVILEGTSAYQLSLALRNISGISVSGIAYVQLPNTVNAYYGTTTPIPIRLTQSSYQLLLTNLPAINSTVPVKINALVTANGTVYNNQIRLSTTS